MPVAYLHPRPPYDFSLSAAIFAGGDPQIRTFEHDLFRQALNVEGSPVLVEVLSEGSVDRPELCLSVRSDTPVSKKRDEGYPEPRLLNVQYF